MGRLRRKSSVLETALIRKANLTKIAPTLDLGHGNTLAAYNAEIATLQSDLDAYNQILAAADDALNRLRAAEKSVANRSTRMLAGVGVAYGKDSSEYEMAGGTRLGDG